MLVLWYIGAAVLSALGAILVYFGIGGDIVYLLVGESDATVDNALAMNVDGFFEWFLNSTTFVQKALVCLAFAVGMMIFIGLCYTSEGLRELPGGNLLEERFGESVIEEIKPIIILPSAVFMLYVIVFTIIQGYINEDANFAIQTISISGEGYSGYQWVTQVFMLIVFFTLMAMIIESFLSAGLLGGVIHSLFVIGANVCGMFLGLVFGVVIGIIGTAIVIGIVILVVIIIAVIILATLLSCL